MKERSTGSTRKRLDLIDKEISDFPRKIKETTKNPALPFLSLDEL